METRDSGLPVDVEALVYDAFFETHGERDAALEALCGRVPEHAERVRALWAQLSAGDDALVGSADGPDSEGERGSGDARPERVGPYRIVGELGAGGFGVVYRALQEEPIRREVALKLMAPGLHGRAVLTRFLAERQALALMNHPAIAKVLDAGTSDDGRPYLAMELVPGAPITVFADRGGLTLAQRLEVFVTVCDAVQHAHQNGVIHRDLKPTNVLVASVDGAPRPKVIDFGVAKALTAKLVDDPLLTQAGALVGTPAYMSPEQAAGDAVDTRTDVYALGVLLHELLIGVTPLDAETFGGDLLELRTALSSQLPQRPSRRFATLGADRAAALAARRGVEPSALSRALRGDLDWILLRALAIEPERRYQTAAEFAADLRRHLAHDAVLARPPSAGYVVSRALRRHRGKVVAAVLLFAVLIAGGATSTALWIEAARSSAATEAALGDLRRVSDPLIAQELVREADQELWPADVARIPEFEGWLLRARPLAERLPAHLRELDAAGARVEGGQGRAADAEFVATVGRLRPLIAGFDAQVDGVEQRIARARELAARSLGHPGWVDAAAAVAADPRFGGRGLEPRFGMVPLGADPESGLQEFAFLPTGVAPERDGNGKLLLTEESGVVLVLVPGGEFWMGAQNESAEQPNHDPSRAVNEGPVHAVALEPFFVGKHEMTQAQWLRAAGVNPSTYRPGVEMGEHVVTPLHPVEGVSYEDAVRVLGRIGLRLPSEAQWEYCARAGSADPWWCGAVPNSLQDRENLSDQAVRAHMVGGTELEARLSDGYVVHAPVGTFAANAFGLFDVLGNVLEWCRDRYVDYREPTSGPDGVREAEPMRPWKAERMFRGGSWRAIPVRARASLRGVAPEAAATSDLGLRPVHPF